MKENIPTPDEAVESWDEMLQQDAELRGMTPDEYIDHLQEVGLYSQYKQIEIAESN
jgi:hypothetical protein